jgi:hypothetical protein
MSDKNIKGGATLWARQIIESDIFFYKPAIWFKIWFYIVSKVNHKDSRLFKRGTNLFNFQEDKRILRCTEDQHKKCIAFLKKSGMIDTKRSTRGNVISVLNYAKYQDLCSYKSTTSDTKRARSAHEASTPINKNEKNEKNEDTNSTAEAVVDEINPLGKKINEFIALFEVVNPSFARLFPRKNQRDAAERMIKQHGFEKMEGLIKFIPVAKSHAEGKFAPTITTPIELEEKLGKLGAFYSTHFDKKENSQNRDGKGVLRA